MQTNYLQNPPNPEKQLALLQTMHLKLKIFQSVNKNNFSPPPKIDSVLLKIIQKTTMKKNVIQIINKIFSYRRKTVKNILKQFNVEKDVIR